MKLRNAGESKERDSYSPVVLGGRWLPSKFNEFIQENNISNKLLQNPQFAKYILGGWFQTPVGGRRPLVSITATIRWQGWAIYSTRFIFAPIHSNSHLRLKNFIHFALYLILSGQLSWLSMYIVSSYLHYSILIISVHFTVERSVMYWSFWK